MAEWQPIETAPKDRLILLCNGPAMTTGQWSLLSDKWLDVFFDKTLRPTHWMPLPEPPK